MKRTLIAMLTYMTLTTSAAWAQDAMHYFKRGLESSMANTRIEFFTKAVELNPNLVEAYQKRALHYYYQRKFEKAMQDYTKVIELVPEEVEAYRMRGSAYLKNGGLEGAIDNFSRAIELDPQQASAYGQRAEAYRLNGMVQEAIRDSTKAIHLGGDARTTANAYATRAKSYRELGNSDLADADFDKSFELDPRYVLYRYLASSTSLEEVRRMGLLGIITLIAVGIFQVTLRPPKKTGQG
ncbi:MAG: tetratricopeptide repeat protein [Deltaproteobacteria bacterium]|nr:MAG: tetratricopeptide repeat protein [Deltaproteobacteria bacterium]